MTGIPRLVFRLTMDGRVSLWTKLILVAGIVYVILPFDILPDIVPALGRIDDLLVIVLSIGMFLILTPRQIVSEHIRGARVGDGEESDVNGPSKSSVIDGSFRYLDDDEGHEKPG